MYKANVINELLWTMPDVTVKSMSITTLCIPEINVRLLFAATDCQACCEVIRDNKAAPHLYGTTRPAASHANIFLGRNMSTSQALWTFLHELGHFRAQQWACGDGAWLINEVLAWEWAFSYHARELGPVPQGMKELAALALSSYLTGAYRLPFYVTFGGFDIEQAKRACVDFMLNHNMTFYTTDYKLNGETPAIVECRLEIEPEVETINLELYQRQPSVWEGNSEQSFYKSH